MPENIVAQIRDLRKMTVLELRQKHLELFGTETRSHHKSQLFKKLAWRVQEMEYGGLSERAKRRAEEIANDLDARFLPPRKPKGSEGGPHEILPARVSSTGVHPAPGTALRREWRGNIHEVLVLEDGKFEYEGKVFRSLSKIALVITGTIWSGPLYFGLRKRKTRIGQQNQK